MTKEELEKLKQTIDYFGHWYDVIGEERVSILEKSVKYIEELEAQIAKMKNRKVFLLQKVKVGVCDTTIDKQFYTTDEELAKEWDGYYKCNYGQAIELEEISDKEQVREELDIG